MIDDAARPARGGVLSADAAAPAAQRLPHLDGLRAMAAMAVLLHHLQSSFGLTLGFGRAYLFVDVFFMLSGFVLTRAWAGMSARSQSASALFVARIHRLWPTMAAASILGAAIHWLLADLEQDLNYLILGLLFVPAIWRGGGNVFPLNTPQWSLFWELLANLAHVLILRRLGLRWLVAINIVMGLLLILAIAARDGANFGPDGDFGGVALVRVGWSYTAGMLIARSYRETTWKPLLPWWPGLALLTLAVIVLPLLPLSRAYGDALMVILILPAFFWLLATARPPIRGGAMLIRLGAISFPLYALHYPVLALFAATTLPRPLAATVAVILSLLLAVGYSRIAPSGQSHRSLVGRLAFPRHLRRGAQPGA